MINKTIFTVDYVFYFSDFHSLWEVFGLDSHGSRGITVIRVMCMCFCVCGYLRVKVCGLVYKGIRLTIVMS